MGCFFINSLSTDQKLKSRFETWGSTQINKLQKLEDALFEQMLATADRADWTWQTGVNRADRRTGLTDLTSDQATESFSFFSHLNFTTISCHYNGYRRFCHRKWKRVNGSEKVTSYISGICEQESWSKSFMFYWPCYIFELRQKSSVLCILKLLHAFPSLPFSQACLEKYLKKSFFIWE